CGPGGGAGVQNPGRSDGDDARPDSADSSTPRAGSTGAPADGATGVPVPETTDDAPRTNGPAGTEPVEAPMPRVDDQGDAESELLESGLPVGLDGFDDDLLFDPLL